MIGRSRAVYDRYPESWAHGARAPNLCSFAAEALAVGAMDVDCLVFGSRGGQVVLPMLWKAMGDQSPPAVVINSGCAMKLPEMVVWPLGAVTFLLLGGQDTLFRGPNSPEAYIANTRGSVPSGSCTTAILYIHEMEHLPQRSLISAILPLMLQACLRWKAHGPPEAEFQALLKVLCGWSGKLLYTEACGWQEIAFGVPL